MKFGLLVLLAASVCSATTIDFASSTSTQNSTGNPSVLATVDPSWATPLASSSWITAEGYGDPGLGVSVTFTESFTLPTVFSGAFLNLGVFADDSATVKIDNTTLFTEDTTLGSHCAAGPIGCTSGNEGVINNLDVTGDLHAGVNTMTFQVFQEVGDTPFGVDFAGSLNFDPPAAVPEPKSILFLCAGLAALAGFKFFQRKRGSKTLVAA